MSALEDIAEAIVGIQQALASADFEATIVWNITQTHLPGLALAVRRMLAAEDD